MRCAREEETATALLMKSVYNIHDAVNRETIAVNAQYLQRIGHSFSGLMVAMFYGWKNNVIFRSNLISCCDLFQKWRSLFWACKKYDPNLNSIIIGNFLPKLRW